MAVTNELDTADGRYAEKCRRAADLMAAWAAEDAEPTIVIDLRDHIEAVR